MPWNDTDEYKKQVRDDHKRNHDIDKLRIWKSEGHTPRYINISHFLTHLRYARPVKLVARVDPRSIPFDLSACEGCSGCGMWLRHPFCSPDSPSLKECRKIIYGYKNAIVFIIQNDGNDPWHVDPLELKHIEFKTRKSYELRGAEAGTSRYIQKMMKNIEHHSRRIGLSAQSFITGKCELCGRCPLRDVRNDDNRQVSCILGGMPSLESWKMNVYRWYTHGSLKKLFDDNLDILKPLKFVCDTHFTLISMLFYDRNVGRKYWLNEKIKENRRKNAEEYKKLAPKLKKCMVNREKKDIPR